MVKYSCKQPRVLHKSFWHALHVHNVSFLYAHSQTEATIIICLLFIIFTMQFFMK